MPFLLRGNVLALVAGVKAEDVNRAFAEPPQSTEQVLHAEKYWDVARRDAPQRVVLRDLAASALGKGWTQVGQGSLGELGLAVLAGAQLPDLQSPTAALGATWTSVATQGWKGDLYQHYANGEGAGLTLLVALWDTEDQARAFQAALVPVDGRRSYRFGAAVMLIGGATEAQADSLAPLALSGAAAASSR